MLSKFLAKYIEKEFGAFYQYGWLLAIGIKLNRRSTPKGLICLSFDIYFAPNSRQEYCRNGEKFAMAWRTCKGRELYALQRVHKSKFAASPTPPFVLDTCWTDIYGAAIVHVDTYVSYPFAALFSIISILAAPRLYPFLDTLLVIHCYP